LTKNSATAIIFFCKKSPSNRMENCLIFTCFLSNDWGSPYRLRGSVLTPSWASLQRLISRRVNALA